MTKSKTFYIYMLVALSVFCYISTNAQELPENATVGDISSIKDDITNRMKNIANSESEISEERRWTSTLKTSVVKMKNSLTSNSIKQTDIDQFKSSLLVLIDRVGKIDCSKTQDCKTEIDAVLNEYNAISNDREIIDVFDKPKEWIKVSNKFAKLYQYFPSGFRPNTIPFNDVECGKMKDIFSNPEIKADLNTFIEVRKKDMEKITKEKEEKITMLNLVEQEINNYTQKLNDAWQKANTKMSLQANLYLMILIIGLLSIATIGIVRWFPDTVMKEWVESGQVIQFVTVMILLSVIMSLGLAGLLGENTLGTLLGGIGGYVLSQGVGRSAARAALKDFESKTESTDPSEKK